MPEQDYNLKKRIPSEKDLIFIVTEFLDFIMVGENEDEALITQEGEDFWELKSK